MTTADDVAAIRAALQARRSGRAVSKIASGGRSVEYAQMTIEELEQALTRAEAELAGRPRRGAIKPYFG
ncbi:MAG TPA: gpW family head-tail joining protein [Vitreimonas sp.]|uniref:gpW family head-tail joining protein n=1 Tax=Vitreimonas sp. TaxID=3069702 RepID=UPI002D498E70|nr:gpW family head-tail joining protein [Vitreimonas sp.]HYD87122.1 gpW family head-tail joining protein [Vitreimonas sp.]